MAVPGEPPRLGWGIVGIGHIADRSMAPAITGSDRSRLVAVVSRDQGRADDFARRHGAPFAYVSYQEMLANPEVGAVLITTPNSQHVDQVVAAAEAKKHVLCDKPMATSVADAQRAVDACRQHGVKLGLNFHYRHLVWPHDLKRILDEGRIGEVLAIQVEASAGSRPLQSWRADPVLAGLGTIYNVGVHIYDLLRFLLGQEVVEVTAMAEPRQGLDVMALSLLRFEAGTLAYVNANQNVPYPQADIDIYGTRGRVVGRNLSRTGREGELRVLTEEGESVTPYADPTAHRLTVEAFNEAILEGRDPQPSGLDGLRSVQLTAAMADSLREGILARVRY